MQQYTVYLYLQTAVHVLGGISTHHQLISLYLQYLALFGPQRIKFLLTVHVILLGNQIGWVFKNTGMLKVRIQMFISVINQLDAQNFCFTISLFHVSNTCAHHQEVKIALHSIWYRHTYRCDDSRGCVMQFWPPDDEHMCSKHVEAWNKLTVKQKFCASSWLITEINILRCSAVNKASKHVRRCIWRGK